CLQSDNLPFTF
nr:immunoglobulin light chain junction region [Mus musculus]NSL97136.1 immunoglobulin light chain junction region [Mus musculus]NSL97148.1 immunoglobulin light chain junction region [Mus musculus]NSL97282.1 immunoglobulin light chain junction region [Mus musculus]NSL97333.1 immunoglobulin light chain junction region [Mus musculus]